MKKILLILILFITIFLIYLFNIDNKIYYLSIDSNGVYDYENGDYNESVINYLSTSNKLEKSITDFSKKDYLIKDLVSDIENNIHIKVNNKNITLKNALIKADLLTISIGMTEINNKLSFQKNNDFDYYKYIDNLLVDIDKLFKIIREYCKEDIFVIGVYYPYEEYNKNLIDAFSYYNDNFHNLAQQYGIEYIDLYNAFLENDSYLSENYVPSLKGYKYISDQIIITINKTVLKNS